MSLGIALGLLTSVFFFSPLYLAMALSVTAHIAQDEQKGGHLLLVKGLLKIRPTEQPRWPCPL